MDSATLVGNLDRERRRYILSIPLFALVPALFVALAAWRGFPFALAGLGAGAMGWTLALALRGPVALATKRLTRSPDTTKLVVVASSGPAEELVRLGAVLLVASTVPRAFWLGVGWSSIEIIYVIVNAFVLFAVLASGDERAEKVLEQLEVSGASMDEIVGGCPMRLVAVAERISASAFHVGATLLLVASPWLVLMTIPVHSGMNLMTLVPGLRRRIWLLELLVAVVGGGMLVTGLKLV